jgi:hypothetical protein
VRQALGYLVEAQTFHGEQTIEAWADYANRLPEELGGMLAELAMMRSRPDSRCAASSGSSTIFEASQ